MVWVFPVLIMGQKKRSPFGPQSENFKIRRRPEVR